MKKMFVKCAIICAAVLVLCMGAQATDVTAKDVKVTPVDETVTVKKVMSGEDVTFSVSKDGTTAGQLYLILIQEGDDVNAAAKPTKDNLYYVDVREAGTSLSADAYPRDLDNGTYVVYLSDYSESNNGAAKGVATIEVKEVTSDNPSDNPDNPTVVFGELDGEAGFTPDDALIALQIAANPTSPNFTDEQKEAAEVDGVQGITPDDALEILKKAADPSNYKFPVE